MDSNIADRTKRAPASKVGGMRVAAHDHSVPVVRKEYERKQAEEGEENEHERQLEKTEQFEHEKQARLDAGERLARMQENHPRNEVNNSFRQRENFQVNQPILHTHSKSGAAAMN
ncbi:hypothetical protein BGW38_003675 [Lunasporangiospora selenospora]|uniref:Uncharacterized protein n=1 Tax=Lunasporangiospora selenospora TaxID=979761 RepID=A0A9P6FQA7_9FUNG|nr:hypothetical protein BGW38_003675 [Lunasporangiospora selenospora]